MDAPNASTTMIMKNDVENITAMGMHKKWMTAHLMAVEQNNNQLRCESHRNTASAPVPLYRAAHVFCLFTAAALVPNSANHLSLLVNWLHCVRQHRDTMSLESSMRSRCWISRAIPNLVPTSVIIYPFVNTDLLGAAASGL